MVTTDSFPKTIAYLNSYRNARIATIFEFVDKLDSTIHVVITNFSAPKKLSLDWGGGGGDCPPASPATTPLASETASKGILAVSLSS